MHLYNVLAGIVRDHYSFLFTERISALEVQPLVHFIFFFFINN
nr:MAG TPA: hypothetical protein [Caudoviricetes sp.]